MAMLLLSPRVVKQVSILCVRCAPCIMVVLMSHTDHTLHTSSTQTIMVCANTSRPVVVPWTSMIDPAINVRQCLSVPGQLCARNLT